VKKKEDLIRYARSVLEKDKIDYFILVTAIWQ